MEMTTNNRGNLTNEKIYITLRIFGYTIYIIHIYTIYMYIDNIYKCAHTQHIRNKGKTLPESQKG